jgi:hypothetical protein
MAANRGDELSMQAPKPGKVCGQQPVVTDLDTRDSQ